MTVKKTNKVGRPTRYKAEYAGQAYKLCLLGATDVEMADFFNTTERTINSWKKAHKEFLQSITRGKLMADAEVAEKLFQRAKGYSHESVKIFNNNGEEMIVPFTEHYPPDTQAASLWLRNRQPSKWRDKQNIDHTSSDGSMSPKGRTLDDFYEDIEKQAE
ncbi:helix-turn-helix domain-containing protein [Oligella urethralis]|uniref:helix-turn-helix domain-containing protein n=1 Tax=Oligella urethralis TaxID=90245 RepID=UPI00288AFC10|nr:helix-turn-helix domain-containing protein [Oligella urethralis]